MEGRVMRIAYVCADPGIPVFGSKGASVHVQEVLRVLLRSGHEVDLFCRRTGGEPPAALAAAIDERQLRVHAAERISDSDAARREEKLITADAELAAVIAAKHAVRGYDVVYERYALFSTAGTTVARAAGVPSILEVNAPLPLEQATHRRLVRADVADQVARTVLADATAVICVSDAVAAWARTLVPASRVHVEPNGVDPERFREVARSQERFTVGFVGTLKPWHGTDALVDAVRILDRPETRLVIVGDGPERDALTQQARAAGVDVEFAGAVDPVDVPGRLAQFDVAVAPYPAHGDTYFSPLKVLEYMAAGVAVVASRVGQIPELVDHGRTGILVPGSDPRALADALDALAADPAQRARLGSAARADVMRHRTWTDVVERSFAAADLALRVPEGAVQ